MKSIRSLIVLLVLAWCAVPRAAPALPQLRGVQEIKSWFNAFKGHPRLILLLSPT